MYDPSKIKEHIRYQLPLLQQHIALMYSSVSVFGAFVHYVSAPKPINVCISLFFMSTYIGRNMDISNDHYKKSLPDDAKTETKKLKKILQCDTGCGLLCNEQLMQPKRQCLLACI